MSLTDYLREVGWDLRALKVYAARAAREHAVGERTAPLHLTAEERRAWIEAFGRGILAQKRRAA